MYENNQNAVPLHHSESATETSVGGVDGFFLCRSFVSRSPNVRAKKCCVLSCLPDEHAKAFDTRNRRASTALNIIQINK